MVTDILIVFKDMIKAEVLLVGDWVCGRAVRHSGNLGNMEIFHIDDDLEKWSQRDISTFCSQPPHRQSERY